ncbi:MAG TPA: GNAT family N-acetyltransferase [Bacteroidales bacterium]|nr:GNAT family N-acetyltransferase [Bacteroidales bacterium]
MITIHQLSEPLERAYETFVADMEHTLFYHSNRFRLFLKEMLEGEDHYLLALEQGQICGALPAFRINSPLGSCLNSLPFFGSNGGIIEKQGREEVQNALLSAFYDLAQKNQALAATIIASPFEHHQDAYARFFDQGPVDHRIGQITELPREDKNHAEVLFASLDTFTRRMIRKALRKEIRVCQQHDAQALDFLKQVHHENMNRIGGKTKPLDFFKKFPAFFRAGADYKIWTAWCGDKMVAALLLFYYNQTVEYYIPAIVHKYRSFQPQSLIIFRAMQQAAEQGYKYWNWGGTWPSQDGVYRFKKQWNTRNRTYNYYHALFKNNLLERSPQEILQAFPYTYVVPFDWLKASN